MEDWTCLGQHKRQPEFPVVTQESRRNSRKTTWLPRHRKMKPFPATAPQEKSHVRNWRSKGHLAPLTLRWRPGRTPTLTGDGPGASALVFAQPHADKENVMHAADDGEGHGRVQSQAAADQHPQH